MLLSELIKDLDITEKVGSLDVEVTDIACHTGYVKKDSCFVAIAGNSVDGHDYIGDAISNGAGVIISSKLAGVPKGVTNLVVANPRCALAIMSSRFFKEPSRSLKLVGITGTNGKTTITYLLESIWKACGLNVGVVGTVNYRYGSILTNPNHTTPDPHELQELLRDMVKTGVDAVAMEVSSHSLDQDRVAGCHFDGGVFTNLTQDHLDYHLDMDRYKIAKSRLFRELLAKSSKKGVFAVINVDDAFGCEIAKEIPYTIYAYSISREVDVFTENVEYSLKGVSLKAMVGEDRLSLKSALIGSHNVSNILGAITTAHAMDIPLDKIKEGVEALKSVPGRLEPVPNSKGLNVLVDYAHTPDALKNVTMALKALKPARLITVFGCGGDRDKTKRPQMGFEVAMRSDFLIVTSDNPRTENPKKIIDEVVAGIKKVGLEERTEVPGYIVEASRKEAIRKAIKMVGPADVVLIAGKGHEDYQIIGSEKLPFDDLKVAAEIIESL